MNRKVLSLILFIATFFITYMIICFCIPAMRIKLDAEPFEYFLKSITHMALIKSAISLFVGLLVGILPIIFGAKK